MKTIKIFTIVTLTVFFMSCKGQEKNKSDKSDLSISKIEVLDFHSTHRCMTCKAIEANTRFTLDTYFTNEVKDGKITFQVINVDKKENESIAEKFETSGTALFLNVIVDGKETPIDLTDFAFMKGNEQEAFAKELKDKLETELETF